tara:strand:- start:2728 stop:3003 length:276 start_codon:yes stop_codon:yes gene_type:complete
VRQVSKKYRAPAVKAAVQNWEISEWFTADQLLPKVMEELPQKTMSVNVYAVSRFLRIMEARGQIIARKNGYGVKEFSKIEGEDDGRSHFYA